MKGLYMKKLLTAILILFCANAFAGQIPPASTGIPTLDQAIQNFDQDASPLTGADLDASACGKQKVPGLLAGDFTGNGKTDYAVLLKIGEAVDAVDENEGESQPYQQIKVCLVVFLTQVDGSFQPVILDELDDHSLPASIYVEEAKPGPLAGADPDAPVVLRHPGIGVVYCGQFETVYYWDEESNDFRDADISNGQSGE